MAITKQTRRLQIMRELTEGIMYAEEAGWPNVRQTLVFRLKTLCLEYCFDYEESELDGITLYFRTVEGDPEGEPGGEESEPSSTETEEAG